MPAKTVQEVNIHYIPKPQSAIIVLQDIMRLKLENRHALIVPRVLLHCMDLYRVVTVQLERTAIEDMQPAFLAMWVGILQLQAQQHVLTVQLERSLYLDLVLVVTARQGPSTLTLEMGTAIIALQVFIHLDQELHPVSLVQQEKFQQGHQELLDAQFAQWVHTTATRLLVIPVQEVHEPSPISYAEN